MMAAVLYLGSQQLKRQPPCSTTANVLNRSTNSREEKRKGVQGGGDQETTAWGKIEAWLAPVDSKQAPTQPHGCLGSQNIHRLGNGLQEAGESHKLL